MKQFRKRNAILACLRASGQHPSAEMVYARLRPEYPNLSLGTVYRNLTLFKEQGLISSVGPVDGTERFDGNPLPHSHFVCTVCGRVLDLPDFQQELCLRAQAVSGGRVQSCQVTFTGICENCMGKEEQA